MLQSIRNHAQGWIAWVIVGLIILTFALFGIDQYARGDKAVVVAEVNGQDIGARAFVSLYNRQKARLNEQFGDMYDEVVKDEELRAQVLDSLIESEVMRQWSRENGMLITDQQLAMAIHSASAFQENGKFSEKIYEDVLMRNGLNVARFEFDQRQYLLETQYRALTMASAFATDYEIEQLAALQGQERNVSYLRVDQRPFLKTVEITDQAVNDVYQSKLADYVEPEMVSVDYIDLSQEVIAKNVEVNDEILKGYFEENVALFSIPEKRQAKHILINVEADSDAARAAAEKTVAEVQAKIAAGEDFAELAKTYSKDPGSADSGGDLGTFEQGMMVPEFDDAVFTMEIGQVSQPVKTDFGYHLIKLTGIEPKQTQAFDQVKSEVTEQYRVQEAERQYFDLLEKLSTIAYEQSDSLEPAAEEVGLKVQTSVMFSRSGGPSEILNNAKVLSESFSEDVLKGKLNSSAIELSSTRSIFVRVNEHKPDRQKSLDEVSGSIKQSLVRQEAIKQAAILATELLSKVEAGENPESLMRDGIEWNTVGWIARNSQKILPQMVGEAFKVAKPTEAGSAWRSHQLNTGDTVLINVSEVRTNTLTAEDKAPLKAAFSELFSNAVYEGRIQALISKADIVKLPAYETVK